LKFTPDRLRKEAELQSLRSLLVRLFSSVFSRLPEISPGGMTFPMVPQTEFSWKTPETTALELEVSALLELSYLACSTSST